MRWDQEIQKELIEVSIYSVLLMLTYERKNPCLKGEINDNWDKWSGMESSKTKTYDPDSSNNDLVLMHGDFTKNGGFENCLCNRQVSLEK